MADTETTTPLDPIASSGAPPVSISGPQATAVKVLSVGVDSSAYTHDETVMGGIYIVDGIKVNAQGLTVNDKGQRVDDSGKLLTPDQIRIEQLTLSAGGG